MLTAALKYAKVVEQICAEQKYGLRKFELCTHEWAIVKQLTAVLKVRVPPELSVD